MKLTVTHQVRVAESRPEPWAGGSTWRPRLSTFIRYSSLHHALPWDHRGPDAVSNDDLVPQRLKSLKLRQEVSIQDCGLFIDPQRSWLAASPDGIVIDRRTGKWLLCLEVKCPYKHRHRLVEDACREDPAFCLEIQDVDKQDPGGVKKKRLYCPVSTAFPWPTSLPSPCLPCTILVSCVLSSCLASNVPSLSLTSLAVL